VVAQLLLEQSAGPGLVSCEKDDRRHPADGNEPPRLCLDVL
jgi:hypothetical protein